MEGPFIREMRSTHTQALDCLSMPGCRCRNHTKGWMMMKNREGYPDPTAGRAIREADRPPENVVMFRRMIKSMCTIFHLRILGKVTIVDEKGRRW